MRAGGRPVPACESSSDEAVAGTSHLEIARTGPDLKAIPSTGSHLRGAAIHYPPTYERSAS